MFRLFGIVTGSILACGTFIYMANSPQEPTQTDLPSMQAMSSQWSDCVGTNIPPCEIVKESAEQTNPIEVVQEEKSAIEQEKTQLVKHKEVEIKRPPVVEIPIKTKSEIAIQQAKEELKKMFDSVTTEEQKAVVENQPASEFAIRTVKDNYQADKLFSKVDEETQKTIEPEWQVFWSPFQTETAARGFAQQIAKSTGVAVQVINKERAKFVVAYPYTSPEERKSQADSIEKIFGMKIQLAEK